jgi:aryl-alcohol dehydrogenase-like predicted oxidoreductase
MHLAQDPIEALQSSLENLSIDQLDGFLFHNMDLYREHPDYLDRLMECREKGLVKKIGFSLYYPEDLDDLLNANVPFDSVQVSYSIFDQRFAGHFRTLREKSIEIHTRSAFLQGLYFADPSTLGAHFERVKSRLRIIHDLSTSSGISIAALALGFVMANSHIDKVVIGVNTVKNLKENIKSLYQCSDVLRHLDVLLELNCEDVNILFPHFWK